MTSEIFNTTSVEMADATADSKPKSAAKIRKRAAKACLSCRARKVRCDVSQRGRPCMNCYLDNESCVVTGRASRLRTQREAADVQASYPPYSNDTAKVRTAEDVVRSRDNGEPPSPVDSSKHDGDVDGPRERSETREHFQREGTPRPSIHREHQPSISSASDAASIASSAAPQVQPQTPAFREPISMPLKTMEGSLGNFSSTNGPTLTAEQRAVTNVDITYSYYPFLTINNLHVIMPQDVNYLEAQGCMRVPTRRILDEFVQQYFLHVHPMLPLFNEGDFWDMYCHQGTSGPSEKIPLVILFAIMFSSCNFVSLSSIQALGFSSIRDARATLYRRTKLLYDFETESSLICLGQAAVLLSYWAPTWAQATKKPNSGWLSIAIQNARSAEAHLQSALPAFSPVHQPIEYKKQNTMKRLWWCCVVRDRILPLGMRRSIQISRAHFDLDTNIGLGYADLADEIDRSKVYNSEVKRSLIDLLVHLVDLCSVLTDLLTLVYSMDDSPGWHRQTHDEGGRITGCKVALRRWYKRATMRFPMFGGGNVPRLTAGSGREFQHESVILYTNLMYMYYHSARVTLCHHELLQLAVASVAPDLNNTLKEFASIYENRHELQDAASGVTECLKELIQLGLARWLPISAVACTATPLALNIIDARLSAANKGKGKLNPQAAVKQHRLNILIEAMRTYQPQYDGVDYVSEAIRHIVNLAQLESMPDSAHLIESGQSITEWTDILSMQPIVYLRIAMTLDLSFSKGRLPEESDFPVSLRGVFANSMHATSANTGGETAGNTTISAAHPPTQNVEQQQHLHQSQPFFTPNSSIAMAPGTVSSMSPDEEINSPIASSSNMYHQHQYLQQQQNPMKHSSPGENMMMDLADGIHGHDALASATMPDMLHLFTDVLGIDNLAGEVLTAYNLNADDGTPPSNMGSSELDCCGEEEDDDDGDEELDLDMDIYDSDETKMKEGDWIGQAWTDDYLKETTTGHTGVDMGTANGVVDATTVMLDAVGESNGNGGDRDTAMALLDALRDDGVSCH